MQTIVIVRNKYKYAIVTVCIAYKYAIDMVLNIKQKHAADRQNATETSALLSSTTSEQIFKKIME